MRYYSRTDISSALLAEDAGKRLDHILDTIWPRWSTGEKTEGADVWQVETVCAYTSLSNHIDCCGHGQGNSARS